ncbi:MAG: putative adhesin [Mucilaginibacter sp.]|nr:putative adhesin [Mucilaginibacter sp.]
MKLKLFNLKALWLIGLMAATNMSIAQSASDIDNTPSDTASAMVLAMAQVNFPASGEPDTDLKSMVESNVIKEKVKKYSKIYPAGNNELKIENSFGQVTVNTWNRNEFKVDVLVKVNTDKETDAQAFLDIINITDSRAGALVSFKTAIGNNDNLNPELWKGDGQARIKKIEINYVIYMPAKNALSINNRYGNTVLPDLNGKLMINNFYGNLKAKKLLNQLNEIKVRSGNVDIETLTGSNLEIIQGSLNLLEGNKLNVDISYGPAKIGRLSTSGNIRVKYCGALKITDLDKNLKTLNITSSYSSVKVGMTDQENANFDITTHYGMFNYSSANGVNILNQTATNNEFSSTKSYQGRLGKGNPGKMITIKSDFGAVKFN